MKDCSCADPEADRANGRCASYPPKEQCPTVETTKTPEKTTPGKPGQTTKQATESTTTQGRLTKFSQLFNLPITLPIVC